MKFISIRSLLYSAITFTFYANAVIHIYTTSFNRPDFIELQYKGFKKFIQEPYEFFVFNDANDPKMEEAIRNECAKFKIPCIRIPQEIHKSTPSFFPDLFAKVDFILGAAVRHGQVLQYAFETIGFKHNDIAVVIDSDIFPIRPISIRDFMKSHEIVGFLNPDHKDFLPNLVPCPCSELMLFNIPKIPYFNTFNFNFGLLGNRYVVTIGFIQFYLASHPEIKCRFIDDIYDVKNAFNLTKKELKAKGFNDLEVKFIKAYTHLYSNPKHHQFLSRDGVGFIDKKFLNYRNASWLAFSEEFTKTKTELIKNFIHTITQ